MRRAWITGAIALLAQPAYAHGFAGPGWLHPLTGPDHMLAMIAVGAWSAQLGGRAIFTVPAAFVVAMAAGGALGLLGIVLPGSEVMIAASVVLLGAVILVDLTVAWPVAALATMLFGAAHGWAHGSELPVSADPVIYVIGFLVTTAGLHIVGVIGGMLLIERPNGMSILRIAGAGTAVAGVALTTVVLSR